MKVRFQEFNPNKFSFHKDPVLAIEDFWSQKDRDVFQGAMDQCGWKKRSEIPAVSGTFPGCGDWLKAEIAKSEASFLLDRVTLPCIDDFIESFPDIKQRHMSFSYYSYGVGDCLSTHDDTGEQYTGTQESTQVDEEGRERSRQPFSALRRIAMVCYLHNAWEHDWGGELIVYDTRTAKNGQRRLEVAYCLEPKPGSIVFFTVPRFHRVCRVDPLAKDHKRLSIAGWFMTEHFS